jgi:hypothetical protein
MYQETRGMPLAPSISKNTLKSLILQVLFKEYIVIVK